eukprot:scaffold2234_cov151-Cylindrotheca_fusiformis.AAC.3
MGAKLTVSFYLHRFTRTILQGAVIVPFPERMHIRNFNFLVSAVETAEHAYQSGAPPLHNHPNDDNQPPLTH